MHNIVCMVDMSVHVIFIHVYIDLHVLSQWVLCSAIWPESPMMLCIFWNIVTNPAHVCNLAIFIYRLKNYIFEGVSMFEWTLCWPSNLKVLGSNPRSAREFSHDYCRHCTQYRFISSIQVGWPNLWFKYCWCGLLSHSLIFETLQIA